MRGPLTALLGIPIASSERRPSIEGSPSLFFHEGRDEKGGESGRVFVLSCRHALLVRPGSGSGDGEYAYDKQENGRNEEREVEASMI